MELAKAFEQEESGLHDFLEHFGSISDGDNALYIQSVSGFGIKVMTVHAAKGLQFPVVVIPFLKLSNAAIDRPLFDDNGETIKLLYLTKNISDFSDKLKERYNREKAKTLMSEMNVLYVSMTRAECELYAVIPSKAGSSKNTARILLGGQNVKRGALEKYEIEKKASGLVQDAPLSGYKDIRKFLQRPDKSGIDSNASKRRGTIIHFALSQIITLKNKNADAEIEKAAENAKRKFPCDDTQWLYQKLSAFFKNREILALFEEDENKIFNEFEVISSSGDIYRMDKVINKNGEVIVVDFKSSAAGDENNKKQMQKYMECAGELFPGKLITGMIADLESGSILEAGS